MIERFAHHFRHIHWNGRVKVQHHILFEFLLGALGAQVLHKSVQVEDGAVRLKTSTAALLIRHEGEVNSLSLCIEVGFWALRRTCTSLRDAIDMWPHVDWVVEILGLGHCLGRLGALIIVRCVAVVAGVWLGGHRERLLSVCRQRLVSVPSG